MFRIALLSVLVAATTLAFAADLVGDEFDTAKGPGRMPAAEMAKLAPLVRDIEEAMQRHDKSGVEAAVVKLREAHGRFAGVPETRPEYVDPIDATRPDLARVTRLWHGSFERMKGRNAWERAAPLDAEFQTGDRLRVSLRAARACLQSHDAKLEDSEEYLKCAREGFDYIVASQGSNGCFGYPYDPTGGGLKKGAADTVAKALASGKPLEAMVENGWIINVFDTGGGGLQFDNGVCGTGLLYVYAQTGDEQYMNSAREAGEWAAKQRIVRNWNYNCFSGQLLARLYRVTGENRWLDEARTKFECGVLPGQMENGRWFDQHNAKIQYHSVMLRALIDYYLALEQAGDTENARRVKKHIVLGLDNLAEQITEYGASNIHEMLALDALSLGSLVFGNFETWTAAANVCVNAICDVALPLLEARGMPMTETVTSYILWQKSDDRKPAEVAPRLGLENLK